MFLNAFKNLFTSKTVLKKGIRRRLELLGLEERIVPATFSVLNDSDSGTGSLRQAIIDANTTEGNDTIDFNFDTGTSPYTITLSSALPNIVDSSTVVGAGTAGTVTINGLGASSLIIDANQGNFSIFTIDTGADLTVSGVTITGANTSGNGGAFNNSGTLTVSNSTLSGNSAGQSGGGIYNSGTLSVSNSTISGNASTLGGGTSNNGTATVSNSTLYGNSATNFGGGIDNSGTLSVSNSTISGNSTTGTGGGIYNSGTLTVSNSTLSGNTAASNGGGIYNSATLNIANTIIANSTKGGDYTGGGTVNVTSPSTAANNLVSQGTFSWATTKTSAEINLGPLANNGGPTFTMALGAGSVAIAAGDVTISNAAPVNGLDQRGFTRITSDIGAYAVSNQITVTTTSDESGHTGISLRDAITLANTAPGDDQISFNLTGASPHTITLSSALPNIIDASAVIGSGTVGAVTITGLGASSLTINGKKGGFSILSIDTGGDLTISGVTVTQVSFSKGAFFNSGALTVNNSTISENFGGVGGGIANDGTLTVNNSTISGNLAFFGGGIENTGTLTVNNSTISGNGALFGGGIANNTGGTLTVNNSTISGNFAAVGGGIANFTGTLTVNNSTISGNKSFSYGGGIANIVGGTITVTNSTISSNKADAAGGGIFNDGTLNIANTIIANSTIGGDYASSNGGTIGTNTNNLVEDGSISGAITGDPLLGPLQNNSGPTFTMALGAGSAAIGAGDSTVSSALPINGLDQRGINRTTSDIGAYSFGIQVTTTADSGAGSLSQAITDANATPGNDQISFNLTGSSSYTITLKSALPNIIDASTAITGGSAGTVSITGLGASSLTIDGNKGDFSIFAIDAGGNLSISAVTVTGANNTSTNGGAFKNLGTLAISDSIISGNSTNQRGGGIYNDNGATLTVNDSTISSNNAYYGGGIFNGVNGNTTVNNSTISSNNAYNGGGIDNHNNSASLTITNSTLSANTATKYGGAIFSNGNLTVTNSTISGNTVSQTNSGTINTYNNSSQTYDSFYGANGGGLYLNSGTATISNSTISGNTASFTNTGNLTVGNIYAGNGGGVSIYNATVNISNSTISGNSASFTNTGKLDTKSNFYLGYGGGIFNNHGILNITNATISGNTANVGGGVYNKAALNISNTIIANSTDGASIPLNDYAASGSSVVNPASTNNIVGLDTNKSTNTWATTVPVLNLGTLTNNGGPTFTIALTSATPSSVTTGGNATISNAAPINALDQRGFARSATTPSIGSYEYYAAPTITSISPSLGIVDGGTSITISGTNFVAGPNVVTIGGVAATNVTVVDSNTITVDTPTGSYGPASVLVTTAGGTNSANTLFTFVYNTTTALTSSTNPSDFGQSVTFTATVTSSSGNPTGSVTFFDGSTNLGSATLTSGTATLSIASLAVGSNSITAEYSGDSSFITSTSSEVTQTVNQASTTTALTSSANPSVVGQSVTFTATVATVSPGAGTATGTVSFFDGATLLGTGTLSSGSATLSTSSLSVGSSFSITAVYNAEDTNFLTSTSSAVSQVVNQASTTTTLTSSTNPSVFGQSVTFTTTVSAVSPGAGTATGTVSFFDGATLLGTGTLSSGSATLSIASLAVGSNSITAVYNADANFLTSTSSAVTQTVNQASTTTTLTSSTNPSVFGQSVTFTTTVSAVSPGAGTATGTVSFFDGTTLLGNGNLSAGTTTLSIASLAVGSNSITAVYNADTNFLTSTSSAVSQVVNQSSTTTALTSSTNPSVFGQSVTFTATVSAVSPGAGTATGTVSFFDGTTLLGTGTLSAGTTTLSTSSLSGGNTFSITAVYAGDSSFMASTSSAVNQVVNLDVANNPTFGAPTATANGFTVLISNYDPNFAYAGTATAGSVSISGTGLVTVTGVAGNTSSTATITTNRTNYVSGSGQVTATSLASTAPLVVGTPPPTSSGGSSTVTLYDPVTGAEAGTAVPFPGFSGPLKVVSGDFNNDGVAEIIAGAGFGGGPAIAILNSQTGEVMESFFAFDPSFTGGVFVAVQDTNGDGILDIIASAGPGGGPEVRIFDGANLNVLRSFFAYAEDFTGGVSVASIDFNNDGILDLVTGAGPGGAPHVKVFDGATNAIISQWYAYPASFTGGVYVAAGDIGNDGNIEVVTGAGQGGSPVVAVWDPYTGALLAQFMAYAGDFTGGVRVGINDGNSDGIADIVTGAGPGGGPQVNVFSFPALDLLFSFYSGDPANTGGVFVS